MQAVLDVAVYSIITLGPPFVVGLEDGPFISFPVVFGMHRGSKCFHPYQI